MANKVQSKKQHVKPTEKKEETPRKDEQINMGRPKRGKDPNGTNKSSRSFLFKLPRLLDEELTREAENQGMSKSAAARAAVNMWIHGSNALTTQQASELRVLKERRMLVEAENEHLRLQIRQKELDLRGVARVGHMKRTGDGRQAQDQIALPMVQTIQPKIAPQGKALGRCEQCGKIDDEIGFYPDLGKRLCDACFEKVDATICPDTLDNSHEPLDEKEVIGSHDSMEPHDPMDSHDVESSDEQEETTETFEETEP